MKCKKCGSKATIHMRQHKLALCKDHFLEWIPGQTQRFIDEHQMLSRDERILVAVSGGKDSLALWDVLNRLGYKVDGLHIDLGINGDLEYSSKSLRFCQSFAAQHDLKLMTFQVKREEGASIPTAARLTRRGREKPCSICGLTKRHVMNSTALDSGYQVLATGHNLDDEASTLLRNTLQWQVGYLQRQGPVLQSRPGFVRKIKPFFRFYERETAAYALLREIKYVYDECPYASGASSIYYKQTLNQLEADRPGLKLSFYLTYLQAKESMRFTAEDECRTILDACIRCGQPTSARGLCAYCRTWDQVRHRMVEL